MVHQVGIHSSPLIGHFFTETFVTGCPVTEDSDDDDDSKVTFVILTNETLARSNSALPDDGDYTETCWSCFNVNFKIVLKTIQLCISW